MGGKSFCAGKGKESAERSIGEDSQAGKQGGKSKVAVDYFEFAKELFEEDKNGW